jgi:lipopolysaccharide transport system ATP-binding protein
MSSDLAISAKGLSKAYRIVHRKTHPTTLAEALTRKLRNPRRREEAETFWALREVDLDVRKGEVVGVIGRNGAGKSTLLKLLSRITEPTAGEARVWGRAGTLLEIGTGFHPELTGRENIFLNGAILGMRRAEIVTRFDGIVEFAEIAKFLDTPVKRYSSGMYLRLAFAVAAYLDAEIMLVDEVLAVGDENFQMKCLGKIGSVVQEGRTVLLVSHNLQAIKNLCARTVLVEDARLAADGPTEEVLAKYLRTTVAAGERPTWQASPGIGNDVLQLERLSVSCRGGGWAGYRTDQELVVELDVRLARVPSGLCIGFDLVRPNGAVVLRSYQTDLEPLLVPPIRPGRNRLSCVLPPGLLNAGTYLLSPRIGVHNQEWIVHEDALVSFRSVLSHGKSPYWSSLNETSRPGGVALVLGWESMLLE